MENTKEIIETLVAKTKQYALNSIEVYKLKAIDKSADVVSTITAQTVVIAFFVLFVAVLSIGVALWAGELLGKSYYGFFIVAGFYAVVGMVLYVFRNKMIKHPIKNSIITQVLN